ncbi:hypothetical protein C9422_11630 [Pseudomonas sp. B1(2018)]|nr:hypothetical protein C9422_11630 [Pseudomonas sp. B1(2018)]
MGASLLAMDVNDNARCLNDRVVWTFFASRLAPTRVLASPDDHGGSRLSSTRFTAISPNMIDC